MKILRKLVKDEDSEELVGGMPTFDSVLDRRIERMVQRFEDGTINLYLILDN